MTPVDMTKRRAGRQAQRVLHRLGHPPSVGLALLTGAGVGVAGIDHHSPDAGRISLDRLFVVQAPARPGSGFG